MSDFVSEHVRKGNGQCFFNFPGCHYFFYVKSTTISRRLLGPVNRNFVEPTAVPTDNDNMPACGKKSALMTNK